MNYLKNLTWTCHVCGDTKPDEKIHVAKFRQLNMNTLHIVYNVRYCAGSRSCAEGAMEVAKRWAGGKPVERIETP